MFLDTLCWCEDHKLVSESIKSDKALAPASESSYFDLSVWYSHYKWKERRQCDSLQNLNNRAGIV